MTTSARILDLLGKAGPLINGEVASALQIDRRTAAVLLRKLTRKGLVREVRPTSRQFRQGCRHTHLNAYALRSKA